MNSSTTQNEHANLSQMIDAAMLLHQSMGSTLKRIAQAIDAGEQCEVNSESATIDNQPESQQPVDMAGINTGSCIRFDWRHRPIDQLNLAELPGMGKGKLQSITAAAPTIGDLKQLIESQQLVRLKGVGKSLAAKIASHTHEYLAAHGVRLLDEQDATQDASRTDSGTQGRDEKEEGETNGDPDRDSASDSQVAHGPRTGLEEAGDDAPPSSLSNSTPNAKTWNSWTNEAQFKFIRELANRLLNSGDVDGPECETPAYYESGWEAYGHEVPLIECSWIPGRQMDDWVRGWLAAQMADIGGGGASEQAEAERAIAGSGSQDDAGQSFFGGMGEDWP